MSTYAASGGYYISAAANQIFASATTLTGSIGVFSVIPTFQRSLEKLGVKVDGIGTTPLAGDMRLDRALAPAGRQILQSSVDHAYAEFLRRVGDGRKKTVEDVDKIAQGRVWAGVDAQRIGLVDHLGGLKDATEAAAKLAELGSDYQVDYIEPELNLREQLLMQLRSESLYLGQLAGLVAPRSDIDRALGSAARTSSSDREAQRSTRAVCLLLVYRAAQPTARIRRPVAAWTRQPVKGYGIDLSRPKQPLIVRRLESWRGIGGHSATLAECSGRRMPTDPSPGAFTDELNWMERNSAPFELSVSKCHSS